MLGAVGRGTGRKEMLASFALPLWACLLVVLWRVDPASRPRPSAALYVSLAWLVITASRLPSQWLGVGADSTQLVSEGNALDRASYLLQSLVAFAILLRRAGSLQWTRLLAGNALLVAFLAYALLSVGWSDYPIIAFKRWVRDFGVYLIVLVALSDPYRPDAAMLLLRRTCFVLIPLSVVLAKYYPDLAREYGPSADQAYFIGVATSKNTLGALCLVSGLYFAWDALQNWPRRLASAATLRVGIDLAFLAMTFWLLHRADSATSIVCCAIGLAILFAARSGFVRRHPVAFAAFIPLGFSSYALLHLAGIDPLALVAEAVGRNPDLTGRADIWRVVLAADTNPLVGTGYESFWLGERRLWVLEHFGNIGQAHNGYLETYLNLGLVGLALLLAYLVGSYFAILRRFAQAPGEWSLYLAFWAVLLLYNVTEAALRNHLLWIAFLLGAVGAPALSQRRRRSFVSRSARRSSRAADAGRDRVRSPVSDPAR